MAPLVTSSSAVVDHEHAVVRYYTSQVMLRHIASDDYDPDGASFAAFGATDSAPFLSIYEPSASPALAVASLLTRPPSIIVLPSGGSGGNDARLVRAVFTVIPAEGFMKEPGQPVFYNDPIELMDQKGRVLGISSRSPFAGHVAADGHAGPLVFVMERHKSRLQTISSKFMAQELRARTASTVAGGSSSPSRDSMSDAYGVKAPSSSTRVTPVEICGGERLRIPGLVKVPKKQFPGGCIMQHQFFSDGSRSSISEDSAFLTCEIVLTTNQPTSTATSDAKPPRSLKKSESTQADRTATGDFGGVLYTGILHRKAEHTKLWRKRFFVLTQVALHRFDAEETLTTVKGIKPRGTIYLSDCKGVRYERFSRPHELEIELNSGKLFSLHAVDAITCANWASVLSRAIENPQWVHSEHAYRTVWRSDAQFESPRCPTITKVVLRDGQQVECAAGLVKRSTKPRVITEQPRWSEKMSLGQITAKGFVIVQLADGNAFRLTLEDLSHSLQQPTWIAVSTSLDVAKINSLDDDDVPDSLSDEMPQRKSEALSDDSSRFLVRLKFRADLQLDKRLTKMRSFDGEQRLAATVASVLILLPAFFYGHAVSLDKGVRLTCLLCMSTVATAIVVFAPVAWNMFLWLRYNRTMEGELHWFLTLLAVEVRPQAEDSGERTSSSSGEDGRLSRVESLSPHDLDENEPLEDGTIVVPARAPVYSNGFGIAQSIRTYRLENALDSILTRPQLSFFAIKKFFPNCFLPRDSEGRRVLLISANQVNQKGLAAHNISGWNVARYFLYLWEFIWSYQDLHEGVPRSELVLVLDCTGWQYFKWFSVEFQMIIFMINHTYRYYPDRLAKLVIIRDTASLGFYKYLLGSRCLDPGVRALIETRNSLAEFGVDDKSKITASRDETALREFVTNLLATYANVTIPSFTRRELEQARHIAMTGTLYDTQVKEDNANRIGTRAVLLPDGLQEFEWKNVYQDGSFSIFRSLEQLPAPTKGKMYQSDARVGQWRGQLTMKTTKMDAVLSQLRDTSLWIKDEDDMRVLDKLSRNEDIAFWSRRVPFMTFSLSGHRDDKHCLFDKRANATFDCVVRRINDISPGTTPKSRVATVMWKTTSAQRVIVNRPPPSPNDDTSNNIQWRKLEDPFVSICFAVEEVEGQPLKLSFWTQSFAPPATDKQTREIAKLLRNKFTLIDKLASQQ